MPRQRWPQFLKQAEEFLLSARDGHERQRWNPSVSNAIHSAILACDAITVSRLGRRNKGEHHEIAALLGQAFSTGHGDLGKVQRRVGRLLEMKNVAEYEGRPLGVGDSASAIEDAERILAFAVAACAEI